MQRRKKGFRANLLNLKPKIKSLSARLKKGSTQLRRKVNKKKKQLKKYRKNRSRWRVPEQIRIKTGLWLWSMLLMLGLFILPMMLNTSIALLRQMGQHQAIAPLFTPQVQHWSREIEAWSNAYSIDPNLMATIMQIESCGHPTIVSRAGAQGLFQVMPFHFDAGETMLDPETNALRSALYIHECSSYAAGDVGLTLACYNGGPSVTRRSVQQWSAETRRYYVWGLGIYIDATNYLDESPALNQWLLAGGVNLCHSAAVALGMD